MIIPSSLKGCASDRSSTVVLFPYFDMSMLVLLLEDSKLCE